MVRLVENKELRPVDDGKPSPLLVYPDTGKLIFAKPRNQIEYFPSLAVELPFQIYPNPTVTPPTEKYPSRTISVGLSFISACL
jgi:hypothetical protein